MRRNLFIENGRKKKKLVQESCQTYELVYGGVMVYRSLRLELDLSHTMVRYLNLYVSSQGNSLPLPYIIYFELVEDFRVHPTYSFTVSTNTVDENDITEDK